MAMALHWIVHVVLWGCLITVFFSPLLWLGAMLTVPVLLLLGRITRATAVWRARALAGFAAAVAVLGAIGWEANQYAEANIDPIPELNRLRAVLAAAPGSCTLRERNCQSKDGVRHVIWRLSSCLPEREEFVRFTRITLANLCSASHDLKTRPYSLSIR